MPLSPLSSRAASPVVDSIDSQPNVAHSAGTLPTRPRNTPDGLPLRRQSAGASQAPLRPLSPLPASASRAPSSGESEIDSDESELDGPMAAIADWRKANDPERRLDLSDAGEPLPPIPSDAKNVDIQDNELTILPPMPEGIMAIYAEGNNIARLPDAFLESIFRKGPEGYFDFSGNPLAPDQILRIREVTQLPEYQGPQILFSAPASMVGDDIKDLTEVGITKLVGYLAAHRVDNVETMAQRLREQGLVAMSFSARECGITTGALYAFDENRLDRFLSLPENKNVLDTYDVPSSAKDFIQYIVENRVQKDEKRELFDLIALTFNDPSREYDGRRPVLSDLDAK